MNLIEKIAWYRRNKGLRALVDRVLKGRETPLQHALGQEPRSAGMTPSAADLRALAGQVVEVDTLIRQSFAPIQPLPIYRAPGPHARINLVTDSV
ncbi:MAG TPA: hypothetical protein VGV14_02580, partial [Rhodanobacter sp.]|nr:hypothetical protein [Rhodanobacter sp.]